MNNILKLQGAFQHLSSSNKPGLRNLPQGKTLSITKIENLICNLEEVKKYWFEQKRKGDIGGVLLNINYGEIVPKSNRVKMLLSCSSKTDDNFKSVRGVRFNNGKLCVTHFISFADIDNSIENLKKVFELLVKFESKQIILNHEITTQFIDSVKEGKTKIPKDTMMTKTRFVDTIVDCHYVQSVSVVNNYSSEFNVASRINSDYRIVTLYSVGTPVDEIFKRIGLSKEDYHELSPNQNQETLDLDCRNHILLVSKNVSNMIYEKYPYLISMSCTCDFDRIKSLADLDLLNWHSETENQFTDRASEIHDIFNSESVPVGLTDLTSNLANKLRNVASTSKNNLLTPSLDSDDYFLKHDINSNNLSIEDPTIEPYIGVIDTAFDEKVYFSRWVEYYDYTDKDSINTEHNFDHGTEVDSIIVDGPKLNPELDDGIGHFRVKHFAVASQNNGDLLTTIKRISDIVSKNQNVKVWNLSLGSFNEISENYISILGSILDSLQTQYDVIFIVAGTNINPKQEYRNFAPDFVTECGSYNGDNSDVIFEEDTDNRICRKDESLVSARLVTQPQATFNSECSDHNKQGDNLINNVMVPERHRLGTPADSINSIVVNSVRRNNEPASYSREGPVLSFFVKPDVSYYGGDSDEQLVVCGANKNNQTNLKTAMGTSFAAPWIARKVAFLIYIMGFTREEAKALIIDAAYNQSVNSRITQTEYLSSKIGHGVVPVHIDKLLKTDKDEIKVVLHQKVDHYENFNYRFPVPITNNKQNYVARATLCYTPYCSRAQGVDYTCTELDIHFGRVKNDVNGKVGIKSVNNNSQADKNGAKCTEHEARFAYRKWDNVKIVSDSVKTRFVPRKLYSDDGMWGIMIRSKERLPHKYGQGMNYALVITLKEMTGVNRIGDFIKSCQLNGWVVNEVRIENQQEIFAVSQQQLDFSDIS